MLPLLLPPRCHRRHRYDITKLLQLLLHCREKSASSFSP
jgi:hypothetical protein